MKLTELHPHFLKITGEKTFQQMEDIKEADGLLFLCPLCYKHNNNSVIGVHSIICWKPHVAQVVSLSGGRWRIVGTGYDDLTLDNSPYASSVLLNGGCDAHFHVEEGEIRF